MRERLLLAIVASALAAVLAFPASAAGQAATEDSVTGVVYVTAEQCITNPPPFPPPGVVCFTPDRFSFDVHSGPAGENPRGTVIFATGERAGQMSDFGTVTCLAVSGNRASVGVNFRGVSVLPPPRDGPYSAIVFVEDNGGEGQDRLALQVLPQGTPAPSVCPNSLPAGLALGPTYPRMFTDDGTITVTDALPVPNGRRMVGKGSVSGSGGQAASYAYILSCNAAANTNAPFEVRFGAQRFRLTSTSSVSCSVPRPGSAVMVGTGAGTLTTGGPGTIQFRFFDGGTGGANDSVQLTIKNAAGTIIFQGSASPPGRFPGSDQATGNNTAQTR